MNPARGREWEMSDSPSENNAIKNITVFEAPLHDTETVELTIVVREGTAADGTDERIGSIRCFTRRVGRVDTVRGQPDGFQTEGGACVVGDPEFPQMQRFDLKGADSHYLIFLSAPNYCT